ncbi:hypothetical protein AXW67_11840 [Bradyrhizobium neotropicale]|uniref:O-antigen ligase domain-containing protein n=1 Tax=Bradyrhizobium neotropicale TaxID=1497615 RepID=A0A176Z986_9BRAD|nr:hypothetical protein AXW67_11840 [Bradyrhizobium neotropicale]
MIASYLLIVLLAATPILAIANLAFAQHAGALVAAIMLAIAARGPEAEIASTAPLLKRFAPAILIPVVWMVLQTFPLPSSLAHPIWSATSIALNDPLLPGRISLDPGATLRSLFLYLADVSLVVSTVILAKDRHRAETILFVLCAVTTFMSVEVLLGRLDLLAGMLPDASAPTSSFPAAAALATVANAALVARAIERHLHQQDIRNLASVPLWLGLLCGLFGIAAAVAAMASLARGTLLAAVGLGLTVIVFIAATRRLGFRSWPSAILFVVLVAIAGALAVQRLQSGDSGLLGLVSFAPEAAALAGRLLSDAPRLGIGVGTFALASRAYQDFGAAAVAVPPSSAVLIAIESGRLALVILAGFAAQLFFFTFRGAVRRGRDFFFASAAAAGVLLVFCESFLDASLLSPAVRIIVAVTIGLGLAQSAGRTSGLKR